MKVFVAVNVTDTLVESGQVFEPGKVFMARGFSKLVKRAVDPPDFVLSWSSGLMHVYPWLFRLSVLLHRLVQ